MDLETPPTFRRAWRGYHPDDVDRFLKETAEERQRLQDALARVETLIATCQDGPGHIVAAAQREAEEIKAAAKAQARQFLEEVRRRLAEPLPRTIITEQAVTPFVPESSMPVVTASPMPTPVRAPAPVTIHEWDLKSLHPEPRNGRSRTYRIIGVAAACVLILVIQTVDFRGARALLQVNTQSLGAAPMASSVAGSGAVVQPLDAGALRGEATLTLTLTALRPCWVRMVVDGKHEMERMLGADETLVLHAHEDVLLRVGDAAALSLLINNRATRPLGAGGQVVTQLITRANYTSLLQAE